jgi:hypothetical protein
VHGDRTGAVAQFPAEKEGRVAKEADVDDDEVRTWLHMKSDLTPEHVSTLSIRTVVVHFVEIAFIEPSPNRNSSGIAPGQ